ncbi:MAG: helix-turn-helix domain-containing protein [Robiginitomaculum sp.]|nr:helix-turn-helix domain-containing protein [Robiginitomaculum sp.]
MSEENKKSNVVKLSPTKAGKASERKWGKPVMDLGFSIIPSLLFKGQRRLGLSPTQLAVLVQLLDFYWDAGRYPHPTKEKLAGRLNISPRQLQRIMVQLEEGGFLRRIERHHAGNGGKLGNIYNLSGLEKKLKGLEPDFTKVKADASKARKEVARPAQRLLKNLAETAKPSA